MIENINIKQVATYDNTGIQVTGLKKVNFIYGANGCGKTTVSNFLHSQEDFKYSFCSLSYQNATAIKSLVYNKEFRERNFGKGKLGGVFTIGEATAEDIKTIEEKSELLKALKADGAKKRDTQNAQILKKEKLDNDFKEFCWTKIFKKYDKSFKEAFVASSQKESFKTKLIQENISNSSKLETLDSIQDRAQTIFGEIPENIILINPISSKRIIEIENDKIWKKNNCRKSRYRNS